MTGKVVLGLLVSFALAWFFQGEEDDLQIKEQADRTCKENCGPRPKNVEYRELEGIYDMLKSPNDKHQQVVSHKGAIYQIIVYRLSDYSAASPIQQ